MNAALATRRGRAGVASAGAAILLTVGAVTAPAHGAVGAVPVPECNGFSEALAQQLGYDIHEGTSLGEQLGDGNATPDWVMGNGGDDVITTGSDGDIICGGPGDDEIDSGDGYDKVFGDEDSDVIDLGPGIFDDAEGGDGDDTITGGDGPDRIYGDDVAGLVPGGRDELRGGPGEDELRGGPKGDTVGGDAQDDRLFGDGGSDVLRGGGGTDELTGGTENDTGHGGPGLADDCDVESPFTCP